MISEVLFDISDKNVQIGFIALMAGLFFCSVIL